MGSLRAILDATLGTDGSTLGIQRDSLQFKA